VDVDLDTGAVAAGTEVLWCIRPEEVRLSEVGTYRATIIDAAILGAVVEFVVRLDDAGLELRARASRSTIFPPGASYGVDIPREAVSVWAQDQPTTDRA
jgi:ABC-type Fe3+/spermidine/putrescine transport system ATPase subunit